MIKWTSVCRHTACLAAALAVIALGRSSALRVTAQSTDPSVVDPSLAVTTVAAGFTQPVAIAFLGLDDYFVIEKGSGRVWRVMNGIRSIVLDLPVNSGSESSPRVDFSHESPPLRLHQTAALPSRKVRASS